MRQVIAGHLRRTVVVLSLVSAVACSDPGGAADGAGTPAEGIAGDTKSSEPAKADGSLQLDTEGLSIAAAPGQLPAGTTVTISQGEDVAPLPDGFTPLGPVLDVSMPFVSTLPSLTLTFKGYEQPTNGTVVVLHQRTSGWEIELPTETSGGATILAAGFSNRVIGFFKNIGSWGKTAIDGTTTPVVCDERPPAWADFAGPPANGWVHMCMTVNRDPAASNERAELRIKSNRPQYLVVRWGDIPTSYVWVEDQSSAVRKLLLGLLGEDSPGYFILPPGATMTVGFNRPVGTSSQIPIVVEQNTNTLLLSALRTFIGPLQGMLDVAGVIAACSQDTVSLQAFVEGGPLRPFTMDDLLSCTKEAAAEGLDQLSKYFEAMAADGQQHGSFTPDEIRDLNSKSTVFGTLGAFLQTLDWGAAALQSVKGAYDQLLGSAELSTTYVSLVASKANAPTTTQTSSSPACTAQAVEADIGAPLFDGPNCVGEWALGQTVDLSGTDMDFITSEVLHFQNGRWSDLGNYFIAGNCRQGLLTSGMPRDVALELAPFDTCLQPGNSDFVELAECVSLESMYIGMDGHRSEVALLQFTLEGLGLNPGVIDGYFGPNTFRAAMASRPGEMESGNEEYFVDEGALFAPMFVRLGIAC